MGLGRRALGPRARRGVRLRPALLRLYGGRVRLHAGLLGEPRSRAARLEGPRSPRWPADGRGPAAGRRAASAGHDPAAARSAAPDHRDVSATEPGHVPTAAEVSAAAARAIGGDVRAGPAAEPADLRSTAGRRRP